MQDTQIMCKIDSLQGYLNFKNILAACDALVFARGKLGINVEAHKIANFQKTVISVGSADDASLKAIVLSVITLLLCRYSSKCVASIKLVDLFEQNVSSARDLVLVSLF